MNPRVIQSAIQPTHDALDPDEGDDDAFDPDEGDGDALDPDEGDDALDPDEGDDALDPDEGDDESSAIFFSKQRCTGRYKSKTTLTCQ